MSERKHESMQDILKRMKPKADKERSDAMDRDPNSMRNILKRLKSKDSTQ